MDEKRRGTKPDGGCAVISAFVVSAGGTGAPAIVADLRAVGIEVVGSGDGRDVVKDVIQRAPDLLVCYETHPNDAFFASTAALRNVAPRPVIVFTTDTDAEKIARAANSGIHVNVVNGYGSHRLRSLIHHAQARFKQDQLQR